MPRPSFVQLSVLLAIGAALCLTTALGPTDAASANLLVNGSFETIADDGTVLGWSASGGQIVRDTTLRRPESGSASLAVTAASQQVAAATQFVAVAGGASYHLSAYAHYQDASLSPVRLLVDWYSSASGLTGQIQSAEIDVPLAADSNFHLVAQSPITSPPNAKRARVSLRVVNTGVASGTVWFDDVAFTGEVPTATPTSSPAASGTVLPTATASPIATPGQTVTPNSAPTGSATGAATAARTATGTPMPTPTVEPGWGALRITEVHANPAATGADPGGEWLEIFNPGSEAVDLTGGTLVDNGGVDDLPRITVSPGHAVIIGATSDVQRAWPLAGVLFATIADGRLGNGLSNTGDRLELRDPAGRMVDTVSWGSDRTVPAAPAGTVPEGGSVGRQRYTNGSLDPTIVLLSSPSPGLVTVGSQSEPASSPTPSQTPTPSPTITPAAYTILPTGGTYVSADGRLTINVPAGALDSAMILSYAPRAWPDPAPGYRTVTGIEILASRVPGGAAISTFQQDIILTYHYAASEVAGLREHSLMLFQVLTPNFSRATVDRAARTATAPIRATGIYALAGETDRAFLPVTSR